MKELILQHLPPAAENAPAQVRLRYKADENDSGQEVLVPFDFALDPQEREQIRWYLEDYLLAPYSVFAERARGVEERLPQIGVDLFRAVFGTDEANRLYGRIMDDLPHTRIRISAVSPEGVSLPWELIRDPARREHGQLGRQAHTFVRGDSARLLPAPPTPTGTTLNILYVLCRPNDEDDVPFQAIARPLVRLFKDREDVHLEVLRPATYARFCQVLHERPGAFQVVHFDGHGFFPNVTPDAQGHFLAATGTEGTVYFDDGAHTGSELAQALTEGQVPVILLNACRSAQTLPGAMFPSVANQLLQGGARAVVAMAYSVYARTAEKYMTRLYERLLSGDELGQAHKQATLHLMDDPLRKTSRGNIAVQDWMVPKLFESSPVRLTQPRSGITLKLSTEGEAETGRGEVGLPEPPQFGFIGRDTAILRLEREFQNHCVVLLWGMAGVGKTEVAAAFARWLADTGALQGPSFFFSFENKTTLAKVLDGIGKRFQPLLKQNNIEWEHVTDVEQRRSLVLQLLRQIPCFVIFDNFEPVAGFPSGTASEWTPEEQADLRRFLVDLRGGASKVLVTSRREEPWLNLPGPSVELAGLRLYEAEELAFAVLERANLTEEAIRVLPRFDALLKYLGGNPLAIQVILPELKRLMPELLLAALKSGEVHLAADDKALGRSRSLAASLIYRLDHLDPQLRERLSVLGLFSGFVDVDVLAIMGGGNSAPTILKGRTADDWRMDLDCATEVGLLRVFEQGMYTMHPALPWFFYNSFEEQFGAEQRCFKKAFSTAYTLYIQFLFGDFYHTNAVTARLLLSLEEANLEQAVRFSQSISEDLDTAILSHFMGNIAEEHRSFTKSEEWYHQSLEIQQRLGDGRGSAVTFHQLGRIAQKSRSLDEAEEWYRKSLEIEQQEGDEHGTASTLHQLGNAAYMRRLFDKAEQYYLKSLEIKQRSGNELGAATTLHQLGMVAHKRRFFDKAEEWYRRSLEIKQRLGIEHGAALTLHQLGMVAQECNSSVEAEQWYRQALTLFKKLGDQHGMSITFHQLGQVAQERRFFDKAEEWYRKSLEIEQRLGDEHGTAQTLHQLGMVAQERSSFGEAEQWYDKALAGFQRSGDEHGAGQTLLSFACLADARGESWEVIVAYLLQAQMGFRKGNHPEADSIMQLAIDHVRSGKSLKDLFEGKRTLSQGRAKHSLFRSIIYRIFTAWPFTRRRRDV